MDWKSQYETVVYDFGDTIITADDPVAAGYVALIHSGKSVGFISTRRHFIDGKVYTGIKNVEIDKRYRGRGYATKMFMALIKHINTAGIASYLPDQVNKKEVPAIWKKIGGYEKGEFVLVDK